jgi:UDP-glucuronate 4-epimerase
VDHPLSLYAATKKATELMAHSYSHLYKIPCTGLRFFTVYGPWGRPDMSLFQFTKKILAGEPIEVFNFGKHKRDFTYIDDIVTGVIRVLDRVPQPDSKWNPIHPNPSTSSAPYRLFNIGNSQPVLLEEVIQILESCLGKKAEKKMMPIQPGDVLETYADISDLEKYVGYRPATPIRVGVEKFASWYRDFYQV